MATLATSFFIGPSSFLVVTKVIIVYRMSPKFGQIRTQRPLLIAKRYENTA